ncbi:MAG: TetR/AcrR family transcriptional regulator [Ignavibacteriaceae bacterium]|jgi:AcrR family transcriptional regulator|nr:TetR/AcrR family transcriptional regulator [Ignavibacteriaceae bacterium]MCW8818268.1 TetR/AcrR family transcriptional regulator [Ignavibacteriaceae bacterium]MCW9096867.1 TetR/AcrR family transcriptional regulator [Ignavibacteriaceae bacterium]
MSPRTKVQFEEIRQKSRENIEKIALELFAIKGYHATSISQIAEKAGISKGLLYNYYKSKEQLLDSVIMKVYDEIMRIVQMSENLPAEKQIEQMIIQTTEHLKKNITFWQLYLFLVHQSDVHKKLSELYEKMRDDYLNYVVKLFKEMGSKNPTMEALMLGTMFDGIGLNYVTAPEGYPLDEMSNYMIEIFVKNKKG